MCLRITDSGYPGKGAQGALCDQICHRQWRLLETRLLVVLIRLQESLRELGYVANALAFAMRADHSRRRIMTVHH